MRAIRIRVISIIMGAVYSFVVPSFSVQAETISLEQLATVSFGETASVERERVLALLARADVQEAFEKYGVSGAEAIERVRVLPDAEVLALSKQIDELPAGGDGVGAVVGGILIVFLVLLLTDILGLTKVFPFTRSINR